MIMSIKIVHPVSQLIPATPTNFNNIQRLRLPKKKNTTRYSEVHTSRVAEKNKSSAFVYEEDTTRSVLQIKQHLNQAVKGSNRGIFGMTSAKKTEIHGLVELLESQNPTPNPTLYLHKVCGCWKLLYSTITILGSKRTKLGLRDFITLGDFLQNIDIVKGKAVNVIKFNVRGLNLLNGQLTIEASFKILSKSRVEIKYESSTIIPDQLMNMFRKNYDVLLGIFNPDGWLDITYVDDEMRIGRDDKGNIFILERSQTN